MIEEFAPANRTRQRAAVLVRGEYVTSADIGFLDEMQHGDRQIDWPDEDLPSAVARLEALLIRRALAQSGGNRSDAAKKLDINRQLLYAKIKRYELEISADTDAVGDADSEL